MIENKRHALLIIPGLGDGNKLLNFFTRNWLNIYGIDPFVHVMPWKKTDETFQPKLNRLLEQIRTLKEQYHIVSLLGTSGGGSAVINAYLKNVDNIHRVVNVCGRLRAGVNVFPSLELAGKGKPAFIESVLLAEKSLKQINPKYARKILTVRPKFDEIVPISTVSLQGAENIEFFSITHALSIYLAMQFPRRIINFLNENLEN